MSRLEQRYRLVLRVLPAAYRKAWEEDMVATFLDSVDSDDAEAAEYAADYGRPSWSEVATVASLAVRRCLGAAGAPPRYVAWGQTVRLVALTGLLVNAAAATIEAGSTLWLATASRLGGGLRRSHDGGHAHRARTDMLRHRSAHDLDAWVEHYNTQRPHQGIGQAPPVTRFQLARVDQLLTAGRAVDGGRRA
jgi:hypothetical protein